MCISYFLSIFAAQNCFDMKKINLFFLVFAAFLAISIISCDNKQSPQEEPEEPISIELLKNRKILSETGIGYGSSHYSRSEGNVVVFDTTIQTPSYDTTVYSYDNKKRLVLVRNSNYSYMANPNKDYVIELSDIILREYSYQYNGLEVSEYVSRTSYRYKNGVIDDSRTTSSSGLNNTRIYTDTSYTNVLFETRESDNYQSFV